MQKLSQLANTVDELPVLDVNFGDDQNATKLSDSLSDWAENAEKKCDFILESLLFAFHRNMVPIAKSY